MALNIDTSLALRTHRQLTELVEAIVAAPPGEPETYSVEWKSTLDLAGDVGARFKVGKSILAFSNRHPDHAAAEFEGCGFIIAGAEANAAPSGIPTHDPAALEDWIGGYVGTDGPRWKPDYVRVAERDVLVVTVEAPRWGDPMHLLRKGFDKFTPGRVFVRRHGQSAEADQDEMEMLQERLRRAASSVRVAVEFDGERPTLFTYETARDDWTKWMERERKRLYRPLEVSRASTAWGAFTQAGTLRGHLAEQRPLEGYEREVEAYLVHAKDEWQAVIWDEVVERELAILKLSVTNPTGENYAAVQVILTLPPGVYAFTGDERPRDILDPPQPPEEWGAVRGLVGIAGSPSLASSIPMLRERAKIMIGDRWTLTFPAVHLRPHGQVALPDVDLAIPDGFTGNGGDIEIGWSATSTSASGRADGVLRAHLAAGGIRISALSE